MMDEGKCFRCGGSYQHVKTCPATSEECFKCGKTGHFKRFCLSKNQKKTNTKTSSSKPARKNDTDTVYQAKFNEVLRAISNISKKKQAVAEESTDSEDCWRIKERRTDTERPEDVVLKVSGTYVKFCIDTGSSRSNIMDQKTYESLAERPEIHRTRSKLFPYGSKQPINVLGKVNATIQDIDNSYRQITFIVTKGKSGNLIGCSSAMDLGLVSFSKPPEAKGSVELRDRIIKMFPKVFSDKIGRVKNREAVLHIDPNIKPVKQKLRPIPVYVAEAVKKELKNLEAQGIIEKVNGPTTWVASIVPIIKKKASKESQPEVRICTDSRDANQAIIRERNKMPTIKELIT